MPYILDVEEIVNFMYKNDQIINSRSYLHELIHTFDNKEHIMSQKFQINDGSDRLIC